MINKNLSSIRSERRLSQWERLKAYLYLWFIDHGILRAPYANLHCLGGFFFRANQPSPARIRAYRRSLNIRTIVNLRGDNPNAAWQRLEEQACQQEGIKLIYARVLSRDAPKRETFRELKKVIESLELPALAHCKSGADRVGLFAVLFRHFRLGHPIEQAIEELHWKYGHFKSAKTGILDFVFDCYLKEHQKDQSFMDWIETDYDRDRIVRDFKPKRWSLFFVDVILRRE